MRAFLLLAALPLCACMTTLPGETLVLGSVSTNGAPRPAAQSFDVPTNSVGSESFAVILNNERGGVDVVPVIENALLNEAAQAHAEDMAENNYLSHIALDGSTPADRVLEVGYDYAFIAENIAQGFVSEEDVMEAWMNSPGHAANILDPRAADFGLGLEDDTWVLLLGDER